MPLTFRPLDETDIPYRLTWLNDPDTARLLGSGPTTQAEQEAWFRKYRSQPGKRFFSMLLDDTPIGIVGLKDIDPSQNVAQVFIVIGDPAQRGKGYGTEAVRYIMEFARTELGLDRLILGVKTFNPAAIRCYEKVGFTVTSEEPDDEELWMEARL